MQPDFADYIGFFAHSISYWWVIVPSILLGLVVVSGIFVLLFSRIEFVDPAPPEVLTALQRVDAGTLLISTASCGRPTSSNGAATPPPAATSTLIWPSPR